MPGANMFFMTGYVTLLLVFCPLLAIDRYKLAVSPAISERLKIILGGVAAALMGVSGAFKLLHLQGADILLAIGALVFAVGFLPFLFFRMYKSSIS